MIPRLLFLTACLEAAAFAASPKPLYESNFEAGEVGKLPEGMMVMSGAFAVKQTSDGKVLELPGEPLETFGLLFATSEPADISASGRFFGTKSGRKFPTFGISLNGVGGYRLQISPGKKALEIYKGDEAKTKVPFDWTSGAWTQLRIQLRKTGDKTWLVEGKAWPAGAPEPASWVIRLEESEEPPPGRPGIWGSPYSGTPIQFDDLLLAPAS